MSPAARVWLIVGPTAVAAGAAALALVLRSDHQNIPLLISMYVLLVAWAFVVAGLIARTRRPENPIGVLLIVVGFTFFGGALTESNYSFLFTLGHVLGALVIAALVHLLLAYPSGRLLSRWELGIVIAGYTVALCANAVPLLFDPDPMDDCTECPSNAFLITPNQTAEDATTAVFNALGFVLLIGVAAVLVRRWRRATRASRRLLGPVLLAGGAALFFFAVSIVVYPLSKLAADVVSVGFLLAFLTLPFLFLWGVLRSRLLRADVSALLEATDTPTLVETQDLVRAALRDPTLKLLYWVDDPGAYFDAESGKRAVAEGDAERAGTKVDALDGTPLAALIHDRALLDEPQRLGDVTAALRLRLEKDRTVRELRISEYRSRALVDAIPDTMFRVARDGTFLDVQAHDTRHLASPPDELIGKSAFGAPPGVLSPETLARRQELVERAFETGEVQSHEYEIHAQHGRRVAEARIVPSGEDEFVMIVRDITDERLIESRSRALLEAIPDHMFRLARDGRYLDFRPHDAEQHGIDTESFLGTSIQEALPPDVVEKVLAAAERAFETGEMQTVEGEMESAGQTVYAEARIVPSGDDEFVMIVRDVSERVEQQRQIERQRDFLSAMGDATTALLCVIRPTGVIAHDSVNVPLRELSGYGQYETDDRLFWDAFVAPEHAAAAESAIREVASGRSPGEQESDWLTKDGRRVTIAWTCTRLPDWNEGEALLISGADVTERVRHEERIQRERDYFGALFDATPSFVCTIDYDGRMSSHPMNESLAALSGYGDQDVAGRSFAEMFSAPEDAELVERTIAAAATGKSPGEQETHWLAHDGRRVLVAWNCTPLPERESDRRLVITGRDVTERKRREDEQAALRRVAVAVASERPPEDVFRIVTAEVGQLLGASEAEMLRFDEQRDEALIVGVWGPGHADQAELGRWMTPVRGGPTRSVWESGETMRFEPDGPISSDLRERMLVAGISSTVVAPVFLSGRVWGVFSVWVNEGHLPPETEERIAQFTALVATALANTEARKELHASRARLVEAGDAERRRLERNLHDGAQQRLVSLSLSLRLAQAKLASDPKAASQILDGAGDELALALEELRELARGLHPAVLTDRGLGAALESLADRAPLPVELEQLPADRLPEPVEAAAFYVVSEALTNVTKYAEASTVRVRVAQENGFAVVEVADDGVGGADPTVGSGLRGLCDRVEALKGRIAIVSPPGAGTRIRAEIPCG